MGINYTENTIPGGFAERRASINGLPLAVAYISPQHDHFRLGWPLQLGPTLENLLSPTLQDLFSKFPGTKECVLEFWIGDQFHEERVPGAWAKDDVLTALAKHEDPDSNPPSLIMLRSDRLSVEWTFHGFTEQEVQAYLANDPMMTYWIPNPRPVYGAFQCAVSADSVPLLPLARYLAGDHRVEGVRSNFEIAAELLNDGRDPSIGAISFLKPFAVF